MPHKLVVTIPEGGPLEFVLENGKFQIGSSRQCEICIPFEEVADVAAKLEIRGEAVFLRNLNPFSIYIGEYELGSGQQGDWPLGQTVLLSRSVSIFIDDEAQKDALANELAAAKQKRSTLQITVILVCIVLGAVLLSSDQKKANSTQALNYDFTSVVAEIQSHQELASAQEIRRRRTLLNLLIDARVPDVRWGAEDPRRAIKAYELLLDAPAIRTAENEETMEGRIRQYALARVSDLSAKIATNE